MHSVLRKIRGLVGTALTWAVGWTVAGFGLIAIPLLLGRGAVPFWRFALPFAAVVGVSGAVVGTLFSIVLGSVHGRRTLEELKPLRMALWGGFAGLVTASVAFAGAVAVGVPIPPTGAIMVTAMIAGFGAVTGGGTVKIAQMSKPRLEAPDPPSPLPPSGTRS